MNAHEHDQRRIVACLNACNGLETELLEARAGTMFNSLRIIERLGKERDALRNFAAGILESWPECSKLDDLDIQALAIKHGLLVGTVVNEPCHGGDPDKPCACAEYCGGEEFADGVTCYRRTDLVKGGAT